MDSRIPVYLYAEDPIVRAGLTTALRSGSEFALVDGKAGPSAAVAVFAADGPDQHVLDLVRTTRARTQAQVILVVTALSDEDLLAVVESGVCSVLWRREATASWLGEAVRKAAANEAVLPSDLLSRMLKQVTRLQQHVLQPRGLAFTGLSGRERDVLKLAAEGFDTEEIAAKLAYSKRTVTSVLHDIVVRYQLRNRAHAIAYAIREGLI
ncbi:helix-turn-helix transcriptional regulator [Actinocrinis sp.]|uniref:helix-turn-helix transcriptional regulator n=1 Tax=Actinocrinis sp. TaxID=1920516 RepID=UPI002D701507|nr:LuxR C-terminal-related transcriptional regulator [Actinocrinis sp.]HZP51959.1 LuxR C-terminal-related transcriptional regulator [Actinocrinis sp.]